MIELKDKNLIIFDNDEEFFNFSVSPNFEVNYSDTSDRYFYTINFTDDYNNAISNDIYFIINDENSQIEKHNCVTYKTISKKIQNLEPYNMLSLIKKINKIINKNMSNSSPKFSIKQNQHKSPWMLAQSRRL